MYNDKERGVIEKMNLCESDQFRNLIPTSTSRTNISICYTVPKAKDDFIVNNEM
jgi:hypothetical protein